jgi:hypothetical protein
LRYTQKFARAVLGSSSTAPSSGFAPQSSWLGALRIVLTFVLKVLLRNIFALRYAQSLGVPEEQHFALRYAQSLGVPEEQHFALRYAQSLGVPEEQHFALRYAQSLGVPEEHLCVAQSLGFATKNLGPCSGL